MPAVFLLAASISAALVLAEATDARFMEAELHRLRAQLLFRQGDVESAETSLHKALVVARRQRAKSRELRVATSLAHLWQDQDHAGEARKLLAGIYGWFTEGFDTPDLQFAITPTARFAP